MKFSCFQFLKQLISPRNDIVIDDAIFRLHYKSTFRLLMSCGLIIIIREYSNDSIDCISPEVIKYPSDLINTFCWTQESFKVIQTIPQNNQIDSINRNQSLDQSLDPLLITNNSYINNFHWLGFLLLIQALFFYLPHCLWLSFEKNKIKCLISRINDETLPEEKREDQRQTLVRYLVKNLHNHEFYALQFISFKIINFVNVITQIVISDCFLNGQFIGLGFYLLMSNTVSQNNYYRNSVYSHVFPRSAICHFHKHSFNFENEVNSQDILCLLPINLIIEKVFLLLWFWFFSLSSISVFDLFSHLFFYISPRIRLLSLKSESHLCDSEQLDLVLRRCKFGDWFLLKILVKNLNANDFRIIICEFSKKYAINEPINSEINV